MTTSVLPVWINYIQALAVPTIAGAAAIIAWSNLRLAERKRNDELFDRRYDFFKRIEKAWLSKSVAEEKGEKPWFDWDDLEGWAQEAEMLFDQDIADHVRSLEDKTCGGMPWVPDPEFSRPFMKHLRLGK